MKVIWTKEALDETKEIYNYYKLKTSIKVAQNLKNKILSSTRNLNLHPQKGQIEELLKHKNEEHRYLIISNYKLIYKITDNKEIFVMKIFDCRRNPEIIKNYD